MSDATKQCVLCWGELLWDMFPSGALLGGAPSNLAVHLAANGLSSALVTRLGSDELGRRARTELEVRGVRSDGLQVDSDAPTGRVGVTIEENEPHYTLHAGAWQSIQCDESAISLLRETRIFCFGTLAQESACGQQSWRTALTLLDAAALRFFDPNLRGSRIDPALVLEHIGAASIVKINEQEAALFEATFGCPDALTWLLEQGQVELVAKTLGPRGAILASSSERVTHPGFRAPCGGDNVGAGDAFSALLLRGTISACPLAARLEAANLYASFVASRRGATPVPPVPLLLEMDSLLGPASPCRSSVNIADTGP